MTPKDIYTNNINTQIIIFLGREIIKPIKYTDLTRKTGNQRKIW